jgi:hypothetical protein
MSEAISNIHPIFFVLPFVGFALIWSGVSLLLSFMSGWRRLAEQFADRPAHTVERLRFQSMRVGASNYRNMLRLELGREGMRISMIWAFRIGHKPLFVPWRAFKNIGRVRVLLGTAVRAELGQPPVLVLMPERVIERARAWLSEQAADAS